VPNGTATGSPDRQLVAALKDREQAQQLQV